MSWLARSLTNSLRLDGYDYGGDGYDDEENDVVPHQPHDPTPSQTNDEGQSHQQQQQQHGPQENEIESEKEAQSRGVKDDLNEFKQTLTRQLWGVASFLAPPPSQPSTPSVHHNESDPDVLKWNQSENSDQYVSGNEEELDQGSSDEAISGTGSQFSEIGTMSRCEVPENLRMDSNLIPFGSESERDEESGMEDWDLGRAVGITDEVLAFARNIAMHPETWLDFPIDEEEDTDDFDMSDAQHQHVLAIERLAPRLAALRFELSPCHMSESYFWKVYFVLLHSRLNKRDAEILSSTQVMAARALWMQELHKQTKPESDWFGSSTSYSKDTVVHEDLVSRSSNDAYFEDVPHQIYAYESTLFPVMTVYGTEKQPIESSDMHFIDKSVIEERPLVKTKDDDVLVGQSSKTVTQDYEDDEDDWLDEDSELGGYGGTTITIGNEEDISFSDLEDDDYGKLPVKSNVVSKG
ncbi:BSD domain-containing family protein [Quillaja saponaria]|uniref:BSD domain-containing family protein n=1 Tax=Quillaja saponaria TaxID=32244 RepID=A0AAD7LY81_QUISA|nr:BSD domain-containing family protein [Quillaja saponaria]